MKTLENSCQFLGTCPDTDKCDGYGSVKIILSRGRKKKFFLQKSKILWEVYPRGVKK